MFKIRKNLRKGVAVAACLAGMTMFVQAQTPVTIDVGIFDVTVVSNSGNPTESQWDYEVSLKTLYLTSSNGDYTLTGTNADLCVHVKSSATNAILTLNGVDINNSHFINNANTLSINLNNFTLKLEGVNSLVSSTASGVSCIKNSGNFTITSLTGGSLIAKGWGNIAPIWCNPNLIISGNANVTAEATGINKVIETSNNIKIDDAAKLTMVNNSPWNETHTFEKLNPTSTAEWKLTNATTTNPLTNAIIEVSVAAEQTGTVERINTTGINEISAGTENATVTGYFDILGRKLTEEPTKGLYIIQYDNGKTKKIIK